MWNGPIKIGAWKLLLASSIFAQIPRAPLTRPRERLVAFRFCPFSIISVYLQVTPFWKFTITVILLPPTLFLFNFHPPAFIASQNRIPTNNSPGMCRVDFLLLLNKTLLRPPLRAASSRKTKAKVSPFITSHVVEDSDRISQHLSRICASHIRLPTDLYLVEHLVLWAEQIPTTNNTLHHTPYTTQFAPFATTFFDNPTRALIADAHT